MEQEWLHDNRICIYTPSNLNDKILSEWSQSIIQSLNNWDNNQFLTLFDLSHPRVSILFLMLVNWQIQPGLTTKGQEYVNRILEARPDLHISLAVVVPVTISGSVTAAKSQLCNMPNITTKMFFDQHEAVSWLEGQCLAHCD